jgi:hypothetical protein
LMGEYEALLCSKIELDQCGRAPVHNVYGPVCQSNKRVHR